MFKVTKKPVRPLTGENGTNARPRGSGGSGASNEALHSGSGKGWNMGRGPDRDTGFFRGWMLADVATDRARQGVEEGVLDAARRLTGVPLLPDARGTVCKASKLTDFFDCDDGEL